MEVGEEGEGTANVSQGWANASLRFIHRLGAVWFSGGRLTSAARLCGMRYDSDTILTSEVICPPVTTWALRSTEAELARRTPGGHVPILPVSFPAAWLNPRLTSTYRVERERARGGEAYRGGAPRTPTPYWVGRVGLRSSLVWLEMLSQSQHAKEFITLSKRSHKHNKDRRRLR